MRKLLTSILAMLMVLSASAASDKLNVGNYSVNSGDALLLPVSLENETELSAFQCDVYLPEGIALALNDEGDLDVTLNSERVTSSHSVTAIVQADGAVRIAAYSTSNKLIKGNTGELFYLNLTTDAEVEGRMRISLRNIIFSTANASGVALDDVSSVVTMTKYVPKNNLIVADASITGGEALQIPVSLENETELSAFQCDVYLPEGIELALNDEGDLDVTLNPERVTSSHSVTATVQADGAVRIAAYSTSNKLIKGNEGELFYLNLTTDTEVEGEKTISLRNIIFSTASAEEVRINDVTGTVSLTKYVPKNDFVLQDVEVKAGKSLLFPVVLTNESELAAFQCDIFLPEGLTLPLDEEGDLDVRLNTERATSSHTITARAQADGSIRVAAYANPTKNFKGNDGTLFYLNLQVDKNQIGEKAIEIKKIICSTSEASTIPVADVKAVVSVLAPVLVSSIVLDKQEVEVIKGEVVTLVATVSPDDADDKAIVWNSSDETVATVQDGVVTTLKVGETVITATTADGSNLSANCTVTVMPDSYRVTYIIDGTVFKTDTLNIGAAIVAPEAPVKEGHTFSGWSELPATMPAQDVTVEGTFTVNQYTLTYTADGAEYKKVTLDYGAAISVETEPTKEGHTFSGWSEVPATMPAKDVTISGSFFANKYAVVYTLDGETFCTDSVTFGDAIVLVEAPAKEGYTFAGWSEVPATMPAKDVTVTGTYTVNQYTLTYTVDGTEYKKVTLDYGATISVETEPTKEGHTFSGWSELPATMPAKDITATGSYTVNKYTLLYLVDGEEYKKLEVEFGTAIVPEAVPAKEGYIFSGWSEIPETMPARDVTVTGSFEVDGIESVVIKQLVDVYTLQGVMVKRQIPIDELKNELSSGVYIVNGKKLMVK